MNADVKMRDQRASVFDEIPSGIVVIDRERNIVDHNRAFGSLFGEARGRSCFEVLCDRDERCKVCPAELTFRHGTERVVEQTGVDRDGRRVHFLVQLSPIRNDSPDVEYVAAITTDLTSTRRLRREYQILFEKVPCYVSVINRDLRVVKANERFRATFGDPAGEHCYRLLKHRGEPCERCPVQMTLSDGQSHDVRHVGVGRDGTSQHYVAFTAPLIPEEGDATHVIHMSLDITDVHRLEAELVEATGMRRALLESSLEATLILDGQERVQMVNPAAERLWGYSRASLIGKKVPAKMIPAALHRVISGKKERALLHDTRVRNASGEEVPVRAAAVTLVEKGELLGSAVIAHDLTEVKRLSREKLDAERLAAVGQTVAGLAHGIKNILTGLEGGMYVTSSGLKKNNDARVRQGWQMLERNMGRISALAKNLLAFSRGDRTVAKEVQPAEIVEDVVGLFREGAAQHGIGVKAVIERSIAPAWMDPDGIHSCLANLISNAMDACLVSQAKDCTITVRLKEKDDTIIFEVSDTGCGMDYEIKQKAFTSFFTTKGKGGTGIGLLITRKIVQQHGGSVTLTSTPGKGATFTMTFPRDRLPQPETKENNDE